MACKNVHAEAGAQFYLPIQKISLFPRKKILDSHYVYIHTFQPFQSSLGGDFEQHFFHSPLWALEVLLDSEGIIQF